MAYIYGMLCDINDEKCVEYSTHLLLLNRFFHLTQYK
jgi:hypothetical protein